MTDSTTKKPLCVSTDGSAGPYIEFLSASLTKSSGFSTAAASAIGSRNTLSRSTGLRKKPSLTWAAAVMRLPFRQSWTASVKHGVL